MSVFGALAVLLCVVAGYEVLEFVVIFVANFAFVILEEHGEYVFHSFALRVTHGINGGIGTFGEELVLQSVPLSVASDDTSHLPEADVVEELTAGDSDFAHEQLIDVVGGG